MYTVCKNFVGSYFCYLWFSNHKSRLSIRTFSKLTNRWNSIPYNNSLQTLFLNTCSYRAMAHKKINRHGEIQLLHDEIQQFQLLLCFSSCLLFCYFFLLFMNFLFLNFLFCPVEPPVEHPLPYFAKGDARHWNWSTIPSKWSLPLWSLQLLQT